MLNFVLPAKRNKKIAKDHHNSSKGGLFAIIFGSVLLVVLFQLLDRAVLGSELHYLINNQLILGLALNNNWSILISTFATAAFVFWGYTWLRLPLPLMALVLSGGMSNIIDRLSFGGVVDYIDLGGFSTVNLCDLVICGALALACIYLIMRDTKKRPA